jgi:hypothetical protein
LVGAFFTCSRFSAMVHRSASTCTSSLMAALFLLHLAAPIGSPPLRSPHHRAPSRAIGASALAALTSGGRQTFPTDPSALRARLSEKLGLPVIRDCAHHDLATAAAGTASSTPRKPNRSPPIQRDQHPDRAQPDLTLQIRGVITNPSASDHAATTDHLVPPWKSARTSRARHERERATRRE